MLEIRNTPVWVLFSLNILLFLVLFFYCYFFVLFFKFNDFFCKRTFDFRSDVNFSLFTFFVFVSLNIKIGLYATVKEQEFNTGIFSIFISTILKKNHLLPCFIIALFVSIIALFDENTGNISSVLTNQKRVFSKPNDKE